MICLPEICAHTKIIFQGIIWHELEKLFVGRNSAYAYTKIEFFVQIFGFHKGKKYFPTEILFFIDKREEREAQSIDTCEVQR